MADGKYLEAAQGIINKISNCYGCATTQELTEIQLKEALKINTLANINPSQNVNLAIQLLKNNYLDSEAWELLGIALYNLSINESSNNIMEIMECFKIAIQLDSNRSYASFYHLGQLSIGQPAIDYYKRGLELASKNSNDDIVIGNFVVGILDVYMNELRESEDIRKIINSYIEQYDYLDDYNYKIQKLMYLTLFDELDSATILAKELYIKLVIPPNESCEARFSDNVDSIDFESLLNFCRILNYLDLQQSCIDVGKSLLLINDEDDRIYHRLSMAYIALNNYDEAIIYINHAMDIVNDDRNKDYADTSIIEELEHLKSYCEAKRKSNDK